MRIEDLKVGQPLWAIDECQMKMGINEGKNALIVGKSYPILLVTQYNVLINSETSKDHRYLIEGLDKYFSLTPPESEVSNDAELLADEQLEKYAEEHARKVWGIYYDDIDEDSNDTRGENSKKDFIAGCKKVIEVLPILKSK